MKKPHFLIGYTVFSLFTVGTILTSVFVLALRANTDLRSEAVTDGGIIPTQSIGIEKAEKKLLRDIPSLPIYPGAMIEYSYKKRDRGLIGYEVKWESPATVTTITQWYLNALVGSGWMVTRIPEAAVTISPPGPLSGIEFMITATKDNTMVNLIIENEHGGPMSEIYAEFPLRKP